MPQKQHGKWTRREFLGRGVSAALVGGAVGRPEGSATRSFPIGGLIGWLRGRPGANEQIHVACIGLGQRGSQHWQRLESVPAARVVAFCDVDQWVLARQAEEFRHRTGRTVRLEVDYRRLVEDPGIDAVSIATCNHTHALIAIAALQTGKDVYLEKPCSHNLWEGLQLVRAVQKYGRIGFHGTQARSSPAIQEAIGHLHSGLIGRVERARIRAVDLGPAPPEVPDEPTPPGVAYDLWLGPAPKRPFNRRRFHRHWRHWPEYGNGPLANQALHLVDLARWGLGVAWPVRIQPVPTPPSRSKALSALGPEVWQLDFPEQKTILVELWPWEGWTGKLPWSGCLPETVTFYGTDGRMEVSGFAYRSWLGRRRQPGPAAQAPPEEFEQFLHAVQTRQMPAGAPDIQQGHLSSGLIHLVNIARHLGRTIQFDPANQTILADPQASALCRPEYRRPFLLPAIA